ncbi:uncharacterized protein LOC101854753 isoform X2 [Aplysia californica]|uniref:Uncharacterized protein LOC101854753 isoform X2 n=1 Tax=Aplysia californica TaxID=6500 RepID=A0ABM1W158_APLCA|nr:uncharacterized protein LOC101854753 isoform X2 [Aplysia californica]
MRALRRTSSGRSVSTPVLSFVLVFTAGGLVDSVTGAYCGRTEYEAYPSGSLTFSSPGFTNSFRSDEGYDVTRYVRCTDKVRVFDGTSTDAALLGEFCGTETPTFESTGNTLLMLFETDNVDNDDYRGFTLEYEALDWGGSESSSSSSFSAGTIVAACIPAIVIYAILFLVVYKKCKNAQRIRRNLAATGHTPEDLRNAMVTMLDQASRGPLLTPQQRQQHRRCREPIPLTNIMMSHMDASAASHQAEESRRRGRVRHPAGDINAEPISVEEMPPLLQTDQNGRDPDHHHLHHHHYHNHHQHRSRSAGHRHHCPPEGGSGSRSHSPQVFTPDPSGVYYEGDIDEHGVLHPWHQGGEEEEEEGNVGYHPHPLRHPAPSSSHPAAPSSSSSGHHYLNHTHLEDDRRSRHSGGGGRHSPYTSGQDSPHGSVSGRGSPYRHRNSPRIPTPLDAEGQTLTYYGMIDQGEGQAAPPPPPPVYVISPQEDIHTSDIDLTAPPPSYEDAASGKYAPNP